MTEIVAPASPLRALLEASANSPLTEADPSALNELMTRIPTIFNKRPLDLTDTDIADTVLYFRHQRAKFATLAKEKADAGDGPKRARVSGTASVAAKLRESIAKIEL